MKFSAWPSVTNPWPDLLEESRHIEAAGWLGLWIGDHFMANSQQNTGPWQESWSLLAAIAALVPRIRLGTLVTGNTYRHPAVLAKQAAQVDVISGGRVTLGIGAGWQENEHAAYGVPFFTTAERLQRLEEAVQVLRSLFDNERTTFEGRHYTLREAPLAPKPLQQRLPILVGGGGEKVTLRIVARYADAWNAPGPPEVVAQKSGVLAEHCRREGRDFSSIWRTASIMVSPGGATGGGLVGRPGWLSFSHVSQLIEPIQPFYEIGLHELIVHFNPARPLDERKQFWSEFLREVAPAFPD